MCYSTLALRLVHGMSRPGRVCPDGCEEGKHAVAHRRMDRGCAGRGGDRGAGGGRGGSRRGWLLYRRVRRRLEGATVMVARYARHNAVGTVAGGRVRLPPRVVYELRRRINGRPEVW